MYEKIKQDLLKLYSSIPNFNCVHCHQCSGPIIWSKPEDLLINDFLREKNIKRITWTNEEFELNNMRCPYLVNHRCLIYPVRPIVCRLQGNIPELKCWMNANNKFISKKKLLDIKKDLTKLIYLSDGFKTVYSTRRLE